MRWTRLILLAVIITVLLFGSAVIVLLNMDFSRFKGQLEQFVSNQTGRSFAIEGPFQVDLGWQTNLSAEGIRFGNPEWATADDMVRVTKLRVSLDALSLIKGPVYIESIEIDGAEIQLEKSDSGDNNWTFGAKPNDDANGNDKGATRIIPLILRSGRVNDFKLTVRNPELTQPLQIEVASLEQGQAEDGLLDITIEGSINSRPTNIKGRFGPMENLLAGTNLQYELDGRFDTLAITSSGKIDDLTEPQKPDIGLEIKGPDIDHVTNMLGVSDLGSGNLDLVASLRPAENGLTVKIAGHLGSYIIDGSGNLSDLTDFHTVDLGLKASGPNLGRAARLFGLSGLPDDPFTLSGTAVRSGPNLAIEQLDLNMGGADFSLKGTMTRFPNLNGTSLDLKIDGSDIVSFRELLKIPGAATGPFQASGKLDVTSTGVESIDVQIHTEIATVNAKGSIGEPPDFIGTRLHIDGSGPDLQRFGNAWGIQSLVADPFKAAGELEITRHGIVTHDTFTANIGHNRLEIDGIVGFKPLEKGTDIRVRASGPDLARVVAMVGVTEYVPAKSFDVKGKLKVETDSYGINDIAALIGDARITLDGKLSKAPKFIGTDIEFSATGPELEELIGDTVSLNVPGTGGPFDASGRIQLRADELRLKKVKISAGNAELRASASIELSNGTLPDWRSSGGKFNIDLKGPDIRNLMPATDIFHPDPSAIELKAQGHWNEAHWTFDKATLSLDDATLNFAGKIDQPPDWSATEFKLDIRIESLAGLGLIYGRRLPAINFDLDAHFSGTPTRFEMDQLAAKIGESDLAGRLALSQARNIPDIDIRIHSNFLDLTPFSALENELADELDGGTDEAPDKDGGDGRVIPELELPMHLLEMFNAQLAIDIAKLHFATRNLTDAALHAEIKDGALTVDRLEMTGPTGQIATTLSLIPAGDTVDMTATFDGSQMVLFIAERGEEWDKAPKHDAQISLNGSGKTLRDLAAGLNGRVRIIGGTGQVPNSRLTAFYGDFLQQIVTAVNPFAKEDPYTEIVCQVLLADIGDGTVVFEPGIVMQTDKMNIMSTGTINLETEKIDLNFKTASRGKIGISAGEFINPYIKVAGTLAEPRLTLDPKGTLVSGGAAVVTMGLSILAKTAWDRAFRAKDPCGEALKAVENHKDNDAL